MKTALVIEDNANNMALFKFILNANGFHALEAEYGLDGIELFRISEPDVVLLDMQLPDIDGHEVLSRLRSTVKGSIVPIIAVSSYALTGESRRLISAGCDGYIQKPIDPYEFIGEVNRIVEGYVVA